MSIPYPRPTLAPPVEAAPYLRAIENYGRDDCFRSFGRYVVTVLITAINANGLAPTKDNLFRAIDSQGAVLDDTRLPADWAEALHTIRQHDPLHFAKMIVQTIASINADCQ